MTTKLKAQESASHVQAILDAYHLAGSQNARYRSELATLQGKVSTLEQMLEQKEIRLRLLTELLDHRGQPRLPEPSPEVLEIEAGATG